MALTPEQTQELSRILNARAGAGRSERPRLRLIVPPTPKLLDPIAREAHIRRIVDVRDLFNLGWLVRQATFNAANLYDLEDCDLIRLLSDMERAAQCMLDGVSFADGGVFTPASAPSLEARPPTRQAQREAERAAANAAAGWDEYAQEDPSENGAPF